METLIRVIACIIACVRAPARDYTAAFDDLTKMQAKLIEADAPLNPGWFIGISLLDY